MEEFYIRLRRAMKIRDLSQTDLCDKTGIPKSAMSQYISGSFKPKSRRTQELASALSVDEAWLMGYDTPMTRTKDSSHIDYDNIFAIKTKKVPLLGDIACGKPIYTEETKGEYVLAESGIDADFCLRAKGDSMIGARINDGDIVFVQEQPEVNNGEIAAIIIEDEATLKRVYYYPEQGKLVLNPENPKYSPLVYVGEELNQIRILGKAVAFQSYI